MRIALLIAALASPALAAAQSPVHMRFEAQSDSFAAAARAYTELWNAEGTRIIATMERISGLRFISEAYADTAITAIVREVASNSGYRERPMTLRASYPEDTKRATLIHELGHRLQGELFRAGEEEHEELFLWVYDVWVELYGQAFADAQVAVEKRRGERYVRAWDGALASDAAERAARWRAIREERMRR